MSICKLPQEEGLELLDHVRSHDHYKTDLHVQDELNQGFNLLVRSQTLHDLSIKLLVHFVNNRWSRSVDFAQLLGDHLS